MIKDDLAALVRQAIEAAQAAGDLQPAALPDVRIERPKMAELGDYSTPIALELRRSLGGNPLAIAETIVHYLPEMAAIETPTVANPGFINFRLRESWLAQQVEAMLREGRSFADQHWGAGRPVQVEFVSANPTGPLHVGNGRGAALGSTLANVLEAVGFKVEREYYVNDAGSQVEVFGRTLYARYQQLFGRAVDIPEGGYPGDYVIELAEQIKASHGGSLLGPEGSDPSPGITQLGIDGMVANIRHDLEALRVNYDVWFRESSLYGESRRFEEIMELLRERHYVANKEDAVWFTSTDLGEDKDNVLIRRDGSPTYFASDIAYHFDKFMKRDFERVIDIWGADHQGHVSRMKAAVEAFGADPEQLTILLYQLVTLKRGREIVRLSKRGGNIITLREVIEEVGADACRFFFLSRSADSQMDFDLELAKRQSNENPVYYVQYAHARIAGILRTAEERGVTRDGGNVELLRHPAEQALIGKMLILPELIETVARTLEPHHLPHYAGELATAFHAFYTECRVVSDDAELTRARLKLTAAARIALARVLELMGMNAPERM